jgi:hypothetical protein
VKKKNCVPEFKEVKAGFCKEVYGTKRAVLPMMMMMVMILSY